MENYVLQGRTFHKDIADKDKYIVFACAKNENEYLIEWIEHYLNYGFDKVIIADNNDDDSLDSLLQSYIEDGTVELFDFRNQELYQVIVYNDFCRAGSFKWCAFFDCDEFLELNAYSNIKDYLETKIDSDCICFNWIMYGSEGQVYKTEGGVQERFKIPYGPISTCKENMFIKSIVRGSDVFQQASFNGSHIPVTPNARYSIGGYYKPSVISHQYTPKYKEGYIKHYYTKSFQEWMTKAKRGWPDGTPTLNWQNYFLFEKSKTEPIEKYYRGVFSNCSPEDDEAFVKEISQYNSIILTNDNGWTYAFYCGVLGCLKKGNGVSFIVASDIEDSLFATLFEYTILTGNKLLCAPNMVVARQIAIDNSNFADGSYYIITIN